MSVGEQINATKEDYQAGADLIFEMIEGFFKEEMFYPEDTSLFKE